MSVVSLILFVVAAVLFLLSAVSYGPSGNPGPRRYPSLLRWGLFVLTLALIAQFIITYKPVHT